MPRLALDGARGLDRARQQALVRAAHGDDDAELGRARGLRAPGGLHHAVDVEPGGAHGRREAGRLRAERAVLAAAAGLGRHDRLDRDLRPAVGEPHAVGERAQLGHALRRQLRDAQCVLAGQRLAAAEHLLLDVPASRSRGNHSGRRPALRVVRNGAEHAARCAATRPGSCAPRRRGPRSFRTR